MKRLSVCHAGLLLGLACIPMSAEAGALGLTSRGTVSISITIAPHVVVRQASRPAQVALGDAADALCIGSSGLTAYSATLLTRTDGRSEAIDLPLMRKGQLPGDLECGQQVGASATLHLGARLLRAIRGSTGPATLLIIPD